MNQQNECQYCGFPAIGICPRCHRQYCPDHVEQNEPFLLCFQCRQEEPEYLKLWGEWQSPGVWADYRSNGVYQTLAFRMGIQVNSSRDLWKVVEEAYANSAQSFWDKAEKLYLNAGNPQGATVCWLRGKGIFTRQDCYEVAAKLADQNKKDEALEIIQRHLSLFPDDADALNLRAIILMWAKQWEKALDDYDTIIKFYPQHPVGYEGRVNANFSMSTRNYAAIERDLKKLESLNSISSQSLFIRGVIGARQVILFGRKEYDQKAYEDLSNSLNKDSKNPYILQARGLLNLLSDREIEGQQDLIRAVDIMGTNAYYDLLYFL